MRNKILVISAVIAFLSILGITLKCGFSLGSSSPTESNLQAPDFTLLDLQSNRITLSALRGKHSVLLFFWTTWCPHCRGYVNELNTMYSELLEKNIKLFAIDVQEEKEKVQKFVKERGLNYPVLLDADMDVAQKYSVFGVPTFIGINKDGVIKFNKNFLPKDFSQELE